MLTLKLVFSANPQTNTTVAPGPQNTGPAAGPPAVPANVNEAQLQKAYAALGLPYNGKQASTLPGNNPNRATMNNQGRFALNVFCIVESHMIYVLLFYSESVACFWCLLIVKLEFFYIPKILVNV